MQGLRAAIVRHQRDSGPRDGDELGLNRDCCELDLDRAREAPADYVDRSRLAGFGSLGLPADCGELELPVGRRRSPNPAPNSLVTALGLK
jgi:hypothetical protein